MATCTLCVWCIVCVMYATQNAAATYVCECELYPHSRLYIKWHAACFRVFFLLSVTFFF